MKTLILMRHAKSSWDNLHIADHDRKLNARGREAAERIGHWLAKHLPPPQEVLCSTAERCVETWERVGIAAGFDCPVDYRRGLYHATPEQMMAALRTATKDVVMMLGHNPGISLFARELLVESTPLPHQKFYQYPTAATLVASFDVSDWSELAVAQGELLHFLLPKELAQ